LHGLHSAPPQPFRRDIVWAKRNRADSRGRLTTGQTAGAFQSGNTVLGTLKFFICAWGCDEYDMPFAVRIP
jgi:hypothetical protein